VAATGEIYCYFPLLPSLAAICHTTAINIGNFEI